MEQEKLTFIKKDALIPITVGAGFISRLQQALIFLLDTKTDPEIDALTQALNDKKELDGWMLHYETLALLIRELELSAQSNGLTTEEDISTSFQ